MQLYFCHPNEVRWTKPNQTTNDQSCSVCSPRGCVSHSTGAGGQSRSPKISVCMHPPSSGDRVSISPQRCTSDWRRCRRGVSKKKKKKLAFPETITIAMPLCKAFTAVRHRRVKYFWLNSITEGCKASLLEATFLLRQVLEAEMTILFIFIQNRAIYNLIITSIYN